MKAHQKKRLPYLYLNYFLLAFISFTVFSILDKSPLANFQTSYFNPFISIALLIFFVFYFLDRVIKGVKFTALDLLIFFLAFCIPVYSGIMAQVWWKQPLMYGVLAQREWLFTIAGLLIFYLLATRKVALSHILNVFLALSWALLIIYFLVEIFLNPANFKDAPFVYCNESKGGCGFKFNIFLLSFSVVYYFIKFIQTNRWLNLLSVFIFLFYIYFITQSRGLSLALVVTIGWFTLFNLTIKKMAYYGGILLIVLLIGTGGLYLIRPDIVSRSVTMYSNIAQVITGEKVGESSADARIGEIVKAGAFYSKNPSTIFWGNGKWSVSWENNPQFTYGYFYPSDLGIIGSVFVYGILGVLIIHVEFIMAFIWLRKIKQNKNDLFLMSCKYYLLFLFLRGIPTGGSCFPPGQGITMLFIALIYFYYYIEIKKDKNYALA